MDGNKFISCYGITIMFYVTSISHREDKHLVTYGLRYYENLEDILEWDVGVGVPI